jgi:lactoylglutathione lyase
VHARVAGLERESSEVRPLHRSSWPTVHSTAGRRKANVGRRPLPYRKGQRKELGTFSVSLAVKDIEASRKFYEKFGFKAFAGNASQNWPILKNADHAIGLFQGMFEKNILTFNPGWDSNAQKLASFTDVRDLQRQMKAQGVQLLQQADESTTGPASFVAVDPDGNPILIDQHV